MRRLIGVLSVAILLAGCGGAAPSPAAPTEAPAATVMSTPAPTEAAASEAPAPTPATGGTAGVGYLVCPALVGDLCPVPTGSYRVDIHDAFGLTVPDAGWVELPSPTEEEPTLILARADAPDQRVIIDAGPTGAILDDADLLHLLDLPVAAGATAPTPVTIGGATGNQVDIGPTDVRSLGLGTAGMVDIEPGSSYRIAALQVPYDQESALKLVVITAPSADFAAFAPLADSLLDTLQFVE